MQQGRPHDRLRELRKAICTQAVLANWLGCAPSYVSKLEAGERNPGRSLAVKLERFTRAFGAPIAVDDWDK
jgi:transcriptional regulator with XRE-family HTH domain